MPTLDIKNLSKSYSKKRVLDGLTFSLETGKTYGLLGCNGVGKTTLFECLVGMADFLGEIRFQDKSLSLEKWRQGLGYLPSAICFFPKTTGLEYLQFCMKARKMSFLYKEVKYLNTFFELPLEQFITSYSHGMKQKIGFFGVLLQKNHTLILDEPFNGLDIQTILILAELLKGLKEAGVSILISSHILSSLYQLCDEILLLRKNDGIAIYHPPQYGQIEQVLLEDSWPMLAQLKDYFSHS